VSKLQDLLLDIPEAAKSQECDGVMFLCVKNGTLSNLGFTGVLPSGTIQKEILYRLLMEAGYAVAFQQPSAQSGSQSKPS